MRDRTKTDKGSGDLERNEETCESKTKFKIF